jgi:hypothetical protein
MEKSAGSLMVVIATRLPRLLAVPAVAGAEEMTSAPVESAACSGGGVAPDPATAPEARYPAASLRLRLLHPRLGLLAAPAVAGVEAMVSFPVESAARSGGGVAPPVPATAAPEARHLVRLRPHRHLLLAVPAVVGAE